MKILILILALSLMGLTMNHGQQREIRMCEGSGIHCMNIEMLDMTLELVKAKGKPEITIREN
ncbi:hypothetical protein [Fulvivirga sedimenti]|jgi:hypothetical protein|uniref:Uncharacterized protein n=1 Tax=Fulvivirga sedimenti TaxID=2879465 RepID=A0A9X1HPX1_9BACT|nr:hypothetical protein [Fulvivirga sedimenti]MCA6074159.1 hypothetical protein [Fulvivirga sedimenti]